MKYLSSHLLLIQRHKLQKYLKMDYYQKLCWKKLHLLRTLTYQKAKCLHDEKATEVNVPVTATNKNSDFLKKNYQLFKKTFIANT